MKRHIAAIAVLSTIQSAFFALSLPTTSHAFLTLTETTPLSFGILATPTRSNSRIIVNRDGGAPTGTAIIISDTTNRGEYLIRSFFNTQKISLDIQNINTGSSALTLDQFKGRYGTKAINSFPKGRLDNPGSSGTPLYLGARLQFTNAVQEQTYNMTFDIVVNYE